ncbi:thioredoxin family protein [Acetobacter sp.]|jgi:thioredoxin-like negative regulator of GroEL|uniref:thioredoxin family protein n=1 Tax=Acetobacter sp. TaxID=440 RepID=UPI0025C5F171|nr:thioredoxin family protein [Acetobacter sp.]MCH4092222.1 thioredoxin family protein [Acetobacter sp.]MCI1299861.1 thioredoxin family protein [Acetobacter sp.]MCI1315879.1 thioredoxin family protein [Acetobacter sp.]
MRFLKLGLCLTCCVALAGVMSEAAMARTMTTAPVVGDDPVHPVVVPYPVPEMAQAQLQAAIARAKVSGKPVLLDFGGNWSPDCWSLSGVLAIPAVSAWIAQNFEVVVVNVSRRNTNLGIGENYGVEITAVPSVLIVSSDGKALNAGTIGALSNASKMTPQSIVDQLAAWGKLN